MSYAISMTFRHIPKNPLDAGGFIGSYNVGEGNKPIASMLGAQRFASVEAAEAFVETCDWIKPEHGVTISQIFGTFSWKRVKTLRMVEDWEDYPGRTH